MNRILIPLTAAVLAGCASFRTGTTYVPEAKTGAAIQKAIDAAASVGGGVVRLEKGVYPSGTLYLRSNVELNIPAGATILGGAKPEDYDDVDDPRLGKSPERSKKAFIVCIDGENVAVTGEGTIDGQGVGFYTAGMQANGRFFNKPPHPRTRMVQFFRCRNVRFEGVEFKDSPGWTFWIRECEDVAASRLRIHGDQRMINNDGLHIDGCRRVCIRDCDIRTGDDCIIMRANRAKGTDLVCEDMIVTDCTLDSACQCIRLSCPADDTIRRGRFARLRMSGNNGVQSAHPLRYIPGWSGGYAKMEDIVIEDCDIDVRGSAIGFWVDPGVRLRDFGNVTFRDVRIKSGKPLLLQGTADAPLRNLRFENVRGTVGAAEPVVMKSVENVAFDDCAITSAKGESVPFVWKKSDSWESDR